MNFTQKTIGFTLIELLVVITIIGILATGGVVTYTSQIQKARDTTRITDVTALQSGVEQFYQDKSEYPDHTVGSFTGVIAYVPKLPKDPKTGQPCNKGAATIQTACDYLYVVATDTNGILKGEYKISSGFENSGNITSKATTDGGAAAEANRLEVGLNLSSSKSTLCNRAGAATTAMTTAPISGTAQCAVAITALMIAGNP
jgi:prepilin-type N-terminal cleavage/methylation domain-containing protein